MEQILVGDEAVWAAGFGIVRIDPSTNEVTAREDLGAWAVAVFRDDRYVWAVAESDGVDDPTARVSAMDPATLEVAGRSEALPATNTGDIHAAIGQGAVWVTGPGGALHRVDTNTFEVESFPNQGVFDPDPGEGPPYVAVAGDAVWLAEADGTLVAVDPHDGRLTGAPIELGANVRAMTVHGGDLLIVLYDGDGRLVRLSGGRETGSANLPEGGPLALAARDDDVFVLLEGPGGDTVVGLDASTLEILDPIDSLDTSGGMGAGPAGVWLSDFQSGTVFRERP